MTLPIINKLYACKFNNYMHSSLIIICMQVYTRLADTFLQLFCCCALGMG